MKSIILVALLGLVSTSVIEQPKGMPSIVVRGMRSFGEIPAIDIIFANGVEDSLVLDRYYPTQQSRRTKTLSCNFFGHLKNEPSGCVSLTGCPGKEHLYFTINSVNRGQNNKFILEQNGNLQVVDGAFKNGTSCGTGANEGTTNFDNQNSFTNFNRAAMPANQKMTLKIHYDETFKYDTNNPTRYLDRMMTHLQSHFCLDSLGTKIQIEAIGGYEFHNGERWDADKPNIRKLRYGIGAEDNSGADLQVFICKGTRNDRIAGIAGVGTLCTYPGANIGLNEKQRNVLSTSEVVAHEIGHNLGMIHDFDPPHGGDGGPCDGKGFMSYGSPPNVWSDCSRNDFLDYYNTKKYDWCLEDYPRACGGTGGKICDGTHDYESYDRECCSIQEPCGLNQGDCDGPSECQEDLICGRNNCPEPFPPRADCCVNP